jgi:hypothetical protein
MYRIIRRESINHSPSSELTSSSVEVKEGITDEDGEER